MAKVKTRLEECGSVCAWLKDEYRQARQLHRVQLRLCKLCDEGRTKAWAVSLWWIARRQLGILWYGAFVRDHALAAEEARWHPVED